MPTSVGWHRSLISLLLLMSYNHDHLGVIAASQTWTGSGLVTGTGWVTSSVPGISCSLPRTKAKAPPRGCPTIPSPRLPLFPAAIRRRGGIQDDAAFRMEMGSRPVSVKRTARILGGAIVAGSLAFGAANAPAVLREVSAGLERRAAEEAIGSSRQELRGALQLMRSNVVVLPEGKSETLARCANDPGREACGGDDGADSGARLLRASFKELHDRYSRVLASTSMGSLALSYDEGGNGIVLRSGPNGKLSVVGPLPGTKASRAGLVEGQSVVEVAGLKYPSLFDAAQAIASSSGGSSSPITLGIEGPDGVTTTLVRVDADAPRGGGGGGERGGGGGGGGGGAAAASAQQKHSPVSRHTFTTPKGGKTVASLTIRRFDAGTEIQVADAIREVAADGDVDAWLLDLRGNPGGLVSAASGVAAQILGDGIPFVDVRGNAGQADTLVTTWGSNSRGNGGGKGVQGAVFVLVDRGSASASEMLASCVREQRRGLIVGGKTGGKGVIQGTFAIEGGKGLSLTTATAWPASKGGVQGSWWGGGRGLDPDVSVPGNVPITGIDVDVLLEKFDEYKAVKAAADDEGGAAAVAATGGAPSVEEGSAAPRASGGGANKGGSFRCATYWACGWDDSSP